MAQNNEYTAYDPFPWNKVWQNPGQKRTIRTPGLSQDFLAI